MKSRRFVDTATVYCYAGSGGDGCVAWRRDKFVQRGGPDGGDGGRGGHVVFRADRNLDSLVDIYFAPHQRADDGGRGGSQLLRGRCGADRIVRVPCGTEVLHPETHERLADLVHDGDEYTAARGGKGGNGNYHWRTKGYLALTAHTDGEPGEETSFRLELKLVADIGFVGFPNAGKSSLLTTVSDAHPRIAPYPFTTLNPIIGTMIFDDYTRITMADLPGLIEGAHEGVGLGHAFLRHIERAPCLVYVLDMAGTDGRDPVKDYRALRRELKLHRADLVKRPMLIVANKMDVEGAAEKLKDFRRRARKDVLPLSVVARTGLDAFRAALRGWKDEGLIPVAR